MALCGKIKPPISIWPSISNWVSQKGLAEWKEIRHIFIRPLLEFLGNLKVLVLRETSRFQRDNITFTPLCDRLLN